MYCNINYCDLLLVAIIFIVILIITFSTRCLYLFYVYQETYETNFMSIYVMSQNICLDVALFKNTIVCCELYCYVVRSIEYLNVVFPNCAFHSY